MTYNILILNGPNLNMLGQRQPEIYGAATLADMARDVEAAAGPLDAAVTFFQSNHEGALIDAIQEARTDQHGLILNAGGLTHTSVALADAVRSTGLPMIELHVSNIYAREAFRHQSYLSSAAVGVMAGFGIHGYVLALQGLIQHLKGTT